MAFVKIHERYKSKMLVLPVVISLTIACLTLVVFRAFNGLLSDSLQHWRSTQNHRRSSNLENIELSEKLHQTYTELAINRTKSNWRELVIAKVVNESDEVKSFYLIDESLEPLPKSLPGQHILVEKERDLGSMGGCRCYSLSDDCSAGHWRITVKKSSDSPHSISRWLHVDKQAGDTLKVKGPSGTFFLEPVAGRSVVLVSAGVGITPMLPMLIESLRRDDLDVYFFTQCRDLAHLPFADSLLNLSATHHRLRLNIWVSRWPNGVRRPEDGRFFEGKFSSANLLRHPGAIDQSDYYLCGPEQWQQQLKQQMTHAGVPTNSIRYELFQQSEKPSAPATAANHNVHFKQSGACAKFESGDASLLACAGKNRVEMESGCRTGACGSCAVRLLSGKVRYVREPQFQLQTSEILPCVCVPESDLEVDA